MPTIVLDGNEVKICKDDYIKFQKSRCNPKYYIFYWECAKCNRIFVEGDFDIDTACCGGRVFRKLVKPFWTEEEFDGFTKSYKRLKKNEKLNK